MHFQILHALGFEHEHQRPDRDDFIIVLKENISDEGLKSFEKFTYNDMSSVNKRK